MFAPLRRIAFVVGFACLALPAQAFCSGETLDALLTPAETADLAAAVAATPFGEGLIWQATYAAQTITLVGTFHLADPRQDALMDRIAPLLAATDRVLVEVTKDGEAELQSHLGANPDLLLLPNNATLIGQLDRDLWDSVAAAAAERQIPSVMAARFQPWYLTMTLAIPTCAMPDLLARKQGLDGKIIDQALALGLPVDPIEDWRTALALLRAGDFDEQVEMLRMSLLDPDLQAKAMASMIDDYFSGRVARIWELNRISMNWLDGVDPAQAEVMFNYFSKGLLTDRNQAWMPVILDAADQAPHLMVAVGAAHLPGKDGLLAALELQGWTITRVY